MQLFGFMAHEHEQTITESSDIDLALEADRQISFFEISELKYTLKSFLFIR